MRFYRILILSILILSLTACAPQLNTVQPAVTVLPENNEAEETNSPDAAAVEGTLNLVQVYELENSSRIVFSELHLGSGDEESAYQEIAVLEDPADVEGLVSSLDQPLEVMAAARCPAKGMLSFYSGEDLTAEFGLGCELEDIFFLSDLQSGQHYRPSAQLLEKIEGVMAAD